MSLPSTYFRQPQVREYFGIPEVKVKPAQPGESFFGFPGASGPQAVKKSPLEGTVLGDRVKQVETEREIREKIEREVREKVSKEVEERVRREMDKRRGKTKE